MQTKQIRVGHGIVICVPEFNHPVKIAERAAVLDLLSGGRLEFGTGRSATWTELGGFRANPDTTKNSWDEFVRAIPQMWMQERSAIDGREVVVATLTHPETIGGADLMPFDNLHLVQLPGGETALIQVDPEYAIHAADRGTPSLQLPDPQALGMRGGIRLDRAIVGFSFKADTDLAPVRFATDPTKPAVQGTRRLSAPARA